MITRTPDDQAVQRDLMQRATEGDPDLVETLGLFEAGADAYMAAAIETWEPPTHVSNTSG